MSALITLVTAQLEQNIQFCHYPAINTIDQALSLYYLLCQTNSITRVDISFSKSEPFHSVLVARRGAQEPVYLTMPVPFPKDAMYIMTCIINAAKAKVLERVASEEKANDIPFLLPLMQQQALSLYGSYSQEPTFEECQQVLSTAPAVVWSCGGIIILEREPVLPHEFEAAFAQAGVSWRNEDNEELYELRQLRMNPNIFCLGARDSYENSWSAQEDFVRATVFARQALNIDSIIKGPLIIGK